MHLPFVFDFDVPTGFFAERSISSIVSSKFSVSLKFFIISASDKPFEF